MWALAVLLGGLGLATPILHGPRQSPRIALTFDADMTPGMLRMLHSGKVKSYNPTELYRLLEQNQVKATFFLSGLWIEAYPEQARALAQNPLFELENHSYTHPGFTQPCYELPAVAPARKTLEVLKTRALLEGLGVQNRYFRFPGGCYGPEDLALVERLGLRVVHWDAAGEDGGQTDPEVIVRNVLNRVHNGSIIVLHSQGGPRLPATLPALRRLIPALKARGFTFVKVAELLAEPAGVSR
ncbi:MULTISPECIES: polysaccharide deacetylase family protein [unclassified Meiothermus]|uniref:polysaccharide deacetylase family protein n=1 Tax=unclassified Meiothermus TaxID=370471 RepID=UPI000D7C6046|nr:MULTISPECIES: polysaccharide deacetylase family protein [unclassified Meiothermus]PZA06680.1 polysaccharide deacetylase [Meiothermus sp. Pnk-1]RYM29222.1 polysaccharide deacetylase [Meiothermus sp. PNK-Is4]